LLGGKPVGYGGMIAHEKAGPIAVADFQCAYNLQMMRQGVVCAGGDGVYHPC
jgi:hypothetical protein